MTSPPFAAGVDSNPSPSSDLSTQTSTTDTTSATTSTATATSNLHSQSAVLATATQPSPNSVVNHESASSFEPSAAASRPISPPTLSASSASSASPLPRRSASANRDSESPNRLPNQNRLLASSSNQIGPFASSSKPPLANRNASSSTPSFTQSPSHAAPRRATSTPLKEGRDSSPVLRPPPRTKTALVTPLGSETGNFEDSDEGIEANFQRVGSQT